MIRLSQPISHRSFFLWGLLLGSLALVGCRSGTDEVAEVLSAVPRRVECPNPSQCRLSIEGKRQFLDLAIAKTVGGSQQYAVKFVYHRAPGARAGEIYFFSSKYHQYHERFVRGHLGIRLPLGAFNRNYTGSGKDRDFNLGTLILHRSKGKKSPAVDKLLVELWSGDEIESDYLDELLGALDSKLRVEGLSGMYWHPLSNSLTAAYQGLRVQKRKFDMITDEELFRDVDALTLNPGEAIGYLEFMDDAGHSACLDHTRIAVFDKIPNELGLVGGVITSQFQTPLSHINIKSSTRGTLNMTLKNARDVLTKEFQVGGSELVYLKAEEGGYFLCTRTGNRFGSLPGLADRPCFFDNIAPGQQDTEVLARFWGARRPRLRGGLQSIQAGRAEEIVDVGAYFRRRGHHHLRDDLIYPDRKAHRRLVQDVGAKATNLGVLELALGGQSAAVGKSTGVGFPKAYALPFSFYDRFQSQVLPSGRSLKAEILAVNQRLKRAEGLDLFDANQEHSLCHVGKGGGYVIKQALADIRALIYSAPMPESVIAPFEELIFKKKAFEGVPRLRIRSSTNSEDLEGFTGAGLYDSKGINLYKRTDADAKGLRFYLSEKPQKKRKVLAKIADKLKVLYGSVWNDRAFAEREWFSLKGEEHLKVKVGVAIHRAFPLTGFGVGVQGENGRGVLITKNIFDASKPYQIYINGNYDDLAVTNPPEAADLEPYGMTLDQYRTEELLVTAYHPDPEIENRSDAWKRWSYGYLGRSTAKSLFPGNADLKQVLVDVPKEFGKVTAMEVRRLTKAARYLSRVLGAMNGRTGLFAYPVDIEWKVDGPERALLIKQIRPFSDGGGGTSTPAGFAAGAKIDAPNARWEGPRLK